MTSSDYHILSSARRLLAVGLLLYAAGCRAVAGTSPMDTVKTDDPLPLIAIDAVDGILAAVDSFPIVAIADMHQVAELGAWRLRLLRDRRLADHVQDIVIEGGNSLYQSLANRFVNGEAIARDSLRLIWNNTTQSPFNTLDAPMYAEDVLASVRAANENLPVEKRLRVLLADPPLEWAAVHARTDLLGKLDRTGSQYRVLADSVLAHGRRALFFCGGAHLHKANARGRENAAFRNVVQRLMITSPRSVYVVLIYDGFGGQTARFNPMFDALRKDVLVPVASSPLAELPAGEVFAPTPGAPADAPPQRILLTGNDSSRREGNFTGLRLGDVADAYLYLGPFRSLTLASDNLAQYRLRPDLLAELNRRQMIRTNTRLDTTDFFAPPASPLAIGPWRGNANIEVPVGADPRSTAIRAVAKAIGAIGGEGRLSRLRSITRDGVREMSDPGQGYRPISPAEMTPPVIETMKRTVVLDFLNGRASNSLMGEIFGGQPFASRIVSSAQGSMNINVLKRTLSASPAGAGPAGPSARLLRLPRQFPEVLLALAWSQRDSLRVVGRSVVTGRSHIVVALNGSPTSTRVFIDSATGVLLKQESTGRTSSGTVDTVAVEYDEWRRVKGLSLPLVQRTRVNQVLIERFDVTKLEVDDTIAESAFASPAGYAAVTQANPRAPTITRIGRDVYLAERVYNSIFVVFDDYVLVVEPVLGGPATEALRPAIAQIAPGKPIRYVVATHFHADHIGGVLPFVAEGTTVVTTSHGADAIRRLAGRSPATERQRAALSEIETVASRRSFTDARHRVDVYQVGPNPHAEQMLVVHLPEEGILFEGDMLDIDVPVGQVPFAGDDSRALLRRIRELRLAVKTIVPVHGRVGAFADLESAARGKVRANR